MLYRDQYTWNIYLEEADGDETAVFLGQTGALTQAEALQNASEYYEKPSHDLLAKRSDVDTPQEASQ